MNKLFTMIIAMILYCTIQYSSIHFEHHILYPNITHKEKYTTLYCTVLYCTVLYCTDINIIYYMHTVYIYCNISYINQYYYIYLNNESKYTGTDTVVSSDY